MSDAPSTPVLPRRALLVGGDRAGVAALAGAFDEARIVDLEELARQLHESAAVDDPAPECVVLAVPPGELADAVATVLAGHGHDLTVLTAVDSDPAALHGLTTVGTVEVSGVQLVQLVRATDPHEIPTLPDGPEAPEPPVAASPGPAPGEPIPTAAAAKAPQIPAARPAPAAPPARPTPSTPPARPARPAHGQGRTGTPGRLLMIGTAAAAIAVAGSVLIAVLTSTGYVGAVVTLALLAALGGAVAVLAYERRAAGRLAERLARSDKRHAGELEQARSETRKHVTSTADRLAAAQRSAQRSTQQALTKELHVIGAATVDTARTLAQHSATEANTHDAAALTAMHQTQAIVNLFSLIPARGIVPPMGGWAASPDVVAVLVDELLTRRPRLVVECGSGVSTLWLALAIDTFGLDTRIVSLDHDPHYAAATRARLAQHRVDRHVEVRDAPLVATGLEGHHTEWYDRGALTDLHDIGLLFVDGPPALTGPLVRWPAVPLLRERFAPAVTIVLDDVVRPAEQETTARWSVLLPDFTVERLPLQKQASVFRRG